MSMVNVRYELKNLIPIENSYQLFDRSINIITNPVFISTNTIKLLLPESKGNGSRDFLIKILVPDQSSYTIILDDGTYYGDNSNILTLDSGLNIIPFTEINNNEFMISKKVISQVAEFKPSIRETTFHFNGSADETYLIEGELTDEKLIELGFIDGDGSWIEEREPTSVEIGTAVTSLGGIVFQNCEALTSISIPDTVISIGDYAFNYCINLSSITLPNQLESIGQNAFMSCRSLTSITVPSSVNSIGGAAFYVGSDSGYALTEITMEGKDMDYVQSMEYYSWSIPEGVTIHCSDGDLSAPGGGGS